MPLLVSLWGNTIARKPLRNGVSDPDTRRILLRLYLDGVITDNDQRHRAPHSLNVSRIRHDVAQVKRLPRPALQNPSARLKTFRKDALPCAVHLGISVPKNIDKSSMPPPCVSKSLQ